MADIIERGRRNADRGDSFRNFIGSILATGGISKKYINSLLDKKGMVYFNTAFTHYSYDRDNNYEILETLGDSTVNKSVVWYLVRKYPRLFSPEATDVLTKLKIYIISDKTLGGLAEELDFWNFLSYDTRNFARPKDDNKIKILEDVFEAFFGSVEILLDQVKIGVGYSVCYRILEKILDKKNYGLLRYEDLVDSKTRLKEMFDQEYVKKGLGQIKYLSPDMGKVDSLGKKVFTKEIELTSSVGKKTIIGWGEAHESKEAEMIAAQMALDTLEKSGYKLNIPAIWQNYC